MPPKPASTRAGTKIGIVQACHLKQKGGEKQTSQGREDRNQRDAVGQLESVPPDGGKQDDFAGNAVAYQSQAYHNISCGGECRIAVGQDQKSPENADAAHYQNKGRPPFPLSLCIVVTYLADDGCNQRYQAEQIQASPAMTWPAT